MKQTEPFDLFPWQKRQAALLYHFASMDYLKGLLPRIDELIAFTDALVERRAPLDAVGRAELNWGPTDTVAHFGTYAYPALQEFRETTVWDIAQRSFERYGITGANQCSRMLGGYAGQMTWAAPDQETEFKERAEKVFKYAGKVDTMMRRPPTANDGTFRNIWVDYRHLFPRLPKFRVRTDVETETENIPPRTGVYVPQDDPYGALQFRWTGGGYGELCECFTLSDIGLEIIRVAGRENPWDDDEALLRLSQRPEYAGILKDYDGKPLTIGNAYLVIKKAFTSRPCKWYFVEMQNDQYEEHDGSYAGVSETVDTPVQRRIPGDMPCPRSGWWYTPARAESRRRFTEGEVFPRVPSSDYGETFWLWSPDQSA